MGIHLSLFGDFALKRRFLRASVRVQQGKARIFPDDACYFATDATSQACIRHADIRLELEPPFPWRLVIADQPVPLRANGVLVLSPSSWLPVRVQPENFDGEWEGELVVEYDEICMLGAVAPGSDVNTDGLVHLHRQLLLLQQVPGCPQPPPAANPQAWANSGVPGLIPLQPTPPPEVWASRAWGC